MYTGKEKHPLFFRRKKKERQDEGLVAKLRRSAADLTKDPKVRREARNAAVRLSRNPRVQQKAREWATRAMRRLSRRR